MWTKISEIGTVPARTRDGFRDIVDRDEGGGRNPALQKEGWGMDPGLSGTDVA